MTEARKERRTREQILQTCVALGNNNNNTSTITFCFIVYSYCVPLFRVQQQRCSSVVIHSKEMHKYLCALHSIGLFRSGSLPHTFSSLLSLFTHTLSLSPSHHHLFIIFLRTCRLHDRSFFLLDQLSESFSHCTRSEICFLFSFFLAVLLDSRFAIKLIALIEINHRKYNTIRDMCLKFDFRDYNQHNDLIEFLIS